MFICLFLLFPFLLQNIILKTHRFVPGTDVYDRRPNKKKRAPAFCDRILWKLKESSEQVGLISLQTPNCNDLHSNKPMNNKAIHKAAIGYSSSNSNSGGSSSSSSGSSGSNSGTGSGSLSNNLRYRPVACSCPSDHMPLAASFVLMASEKVESLVLR